MSEKFDPSKDFETVEQDVQQGSFFLPENELTDDDRASLSRSLGMQEEEIGVGEALLKGAQQGVSFGFADELAGVAGALGSAVGAPAPKDISLENLVKTYQEARDIERQRSKLAQEQSPVASTVGELAGGFALPSMAAGSVVKGTASIGKKILDALKVGAAGGGLYGAGMSEAEIPKELAQDIGAGAAGGAIVGAALPPIAKTASQVGKGIKASGEWVAETPFLKYPFTSYKTAAKEGRILGSEKAADVSRDLLKKEVKNLAGDVSKAEELISKEYEKILNEIDAKGIKYGLEDVDKSLKKIEELKSKERFTDTLDNLNKLEELLTTYKKGREDIVGYTPKVQKPKQDEYQKKLSELQEQRAKLSITKEQPEMITEEAVKKGIAEKTQLSKLNQKTLAKKAADGEDFGDYIPKAVQEEAPIAKFSEPELVIDEATGKRMIQAVDEESGQTVLKAFDDIDPSEISTGTDPITGMDFFKFTDKGTGKVYSKVIKPKEEKLFTEIEPVYARKQLSEELSARDVKELSSALWDRITRGKFDDYKTEAIARDLAIASKKKLQENPGYAALDEKFRIKEGVLDLLKLKDKDVSKDPQALIDLTEKMMGLEKDPKTRDVLKTALNEMEKIVPGTKEKYLEKLNKYSLESTVSEQAVARPIVFGKPVLAAGAAGAAVKGAKESLSNFVQDNIVNNTPEAIRSLSTKVWSSGSEKAKQLATRLHDMAMRDKRGRQAIMFSIMQDPDYRKMIEKYSGKQVEGQGGQQ